MSAFEPLFDPLMPGESPASPPEAGILPLEAWVHRGSVGDEEMRWQDGICGSFMESAISKGFARAFEAVGSDQAFLGFSRRLVHERMMDAVGSFKPGRSLIRDAYGDPGLCESMLIRGSEALAGDALDPECLARPEFPLRCAADALLVAGFEWSAMNALHCNRGVLAWNIVASRANAELPDNLKQAFLAGTDPISFAGAAKKELMLERAQGLAGWADDCWSAVLERCGMVDKNETRYACGR